MTDNAIVSINENAIIRPVMSINDALTTYDAMVDFTRKALKEGQDYGVIPGTSKNTLLKPGAEKLSRFFGLSPRFRVEKEIENWEAEEPFFYYRVHCTLYRMGTDIIVAEGFGSCNSKEKKYRWRTGERICPNCGEAAIIKGKAEYGGGWVCWNRKGGCGSKFADNDPAITSQNTQIINPDMEDLPNTLLKMAKKRAFIDATLTATNASEFYTQDMEDYDFAPAGDVVDSTAVPVEATPQQAAPEKPKLVEPDNFVRDADNIVSYVIQLIEAYDGPPFGLTQYHASINGLFQSEEERHDFQSFVMGKQSSKDFTDAERHALVEYFTDERMTKDKARQAIEKVVKAYQLTVVPVEKKTA
jgi:hypothetical protein